MDLELQAYIKARVIVDANGCWIWQRAVGTNGYGAAWRADLKKMWPAHRVSWVAFTDEPLIRGQNLDHLCRVPLCLNTSHLEQVSVRENLRRGHHKNMITAVTDVCPRGHKDDFVLRADGRRRCRQCFYDARRKRDLARLVRSGNLETCRVCSRPFANITLHYRNYAPCRGVA